MIKVGLTGGIGSGKSIIAQLFTLLGIYVYDTDTVAKQMYYTNTELKQKLILNFGKKVYFKSGELNKQHLSNQVFEDKKKLTLLNSLVHPLVKADFEQKIILYKNSPYIIKESAILIESKAYKTIDKIIVVTAPESIRVNRVCKRDNSSHSEVMKRIKNQLSDNERLEYADYIIKNNDKEPLIHQVLNIHESIMKICKNETP